LPQISVAVPHHTAADRDRQAVSAWVPWGRCRRMAAWAEIDGNPRSVRYQTDPLPGRLYAGPV